MTGPAAASAGVVAPTRAAAARLRAPAVPLAGRLASQGGAVRRASPVSPEPVGVAARVAALAAGVVEPPAAPVGQAAAVVPPVELQVAAPAVQSQVAAAPPAAAAGAVEAGAAAP